MVNKRHSIKKSSACQSTSKRREAQLIVAKRRKEARKKKQADFLKSDGIEFSTKAIIGEDGIEYVNVPYGTGFKKTMKSKVLARFEGKVVEEINALGGVRKVGKARNEKLRKILEEYQTTTISKPDHGIVWGDDFFALTTNGSIKSMRTRLSSKTLTKRRSTSRSIAAAKRKSPSFDKEAKNAYDRENNHSRYHEDAQHRREKVQYQRVYDKEVRSEMQ